VKPSQATRCPNRITSTRRSKHSYWAFGLLVGSAVAQAAWVTDGQLRADSAYDDNPTLSSTGEDDSVINTVHGQAEVRQVTESSSISAIGGISYIDYVDPHADGADLNDKDTEFADIRSSWRGERLGWGLNGSFRRDVLLRTIGFIRDPLPAGGTDGGDTTSGGDVGGDHPPNGPPPGDNVDAGSVDRQIRRYLGYVSPSVNYALTERTSAQLAYIYSSLHYDRGDEVGLENSQTNGVRAELERSLSETDRVRLSMAAARFDPELSTKVDAYEMTAGWTRKYSEVAGLSVDAGASYADSQDGQTDNGFVIRVRGYRNTEVGRMFVQAERQLYPTGYGLVETDRLTLGFEHAMSDTVRLALMGDSYKTSGNNERKYISVGPNLTWSLNSNYSVGATYHYYWVDRESDPGGAASGNSVGVFIAYRPQREF